MLCEKCQRREATIHFTKIEGDEMTKIHLCAECAAPNFHTEDVRPVKPFIPRIGMLEHPPMRRATLCDKCHEREATVHICKIDGNNTTTSDFCEQCARPEMSEQKGIELGNLLEILASGQSWVPTRDEIVQCFAGRTMRYPIDAYEFVCWALENCLKGTHVSARVLLEAIRELALKKFGKRAKAALAEWKIIRTEDFGEIVFEMIDAGALCKQPEDSKEDFQNGFDFDEAFPES